MSIPRVGVGGWNLGGILDNFSSNDMFKICKKKKQNKTKQNDDDKSHAIQGACFICSNNILTAFVN